MGRLFELPYRIKDVNIDSNFRSIKEKMNAIVTVVTGNMSAPPTSGRYYVGQIVFNSSPSVGEQVGWICIEEGEPGTWRGFGIISSG